MTTAKLPKRDANGRFLSSSKKQTKKPLGHRMTAHKIAQRVPKHKPNKPTSPKPKKVLNHVGLVVDCSGSMRDCWETVQQELKRNVNTVRGESIRTGQETTLSVIAFGDYVKEVFAGTPIKDASFPENLLPNMGYTALFDAVSKMITTMSRLPDANDASMVIIVLTDGAENHSQTTATELRRLIDLKQKTDRWSFAFLVPPNHKKNITSGLGLPEGNVIEWENNEKGSQIAGASITRGISSYYNMRSTTTRLSTQGFFTSNASKISSSDVENNLDDISNEVKIWPVPREIAIRDFVEEKIGTYTLGRAFYQLTKDELIECEKDIMIVPKGKKEVYIGSKVRDLLKLPKKEDVKVRPGNHGDWDIFVQSHSVNRKLVRGTKVIYRV